MIEYSYIYNFLNNHAIKMLSVPRGTEEWVKENTNSAAELYNLLCEEEKYMLEGVRTYGSDTWTIKFGDTNDFV